MLALRLARGARPLVHLRRALLAAASAGTGFLLLCALGWALGHPSSAAESALRLAWCVVPLAATVHYSLAVARTDPGVRPRTALSAAGLGPSGLALLSAVSAGAACALGSGLALFVFLLLRGDLPSLPYSGAAAELLAHDRPLPLAAIGTLLLVTPVAVGAACRLALRARHRSREVEPDPDDEEAPAARPAPAGLPWGIALLAAGLAVEAYTHGSPDSSSLVPGALADSPAGVVGGWALTAVGLVLAGPGLAYQCGRALQAVRPGAMRLLAGRVLQQEAARVGRPLGVLCAVASAGFAAATLYADHGPGPLGALGALLVTGCAVAALLTAVAEARQERERIREALLDLGAAPTLLRGAVVLRAGALLAVFGPVTWLVAELAALPLS